MLPHRFAELSRRTGLGPRRLFVLTHKFTTSCCDRPHSEQRCVTAPQHLSHLPEGAFHLIRFATLSTFPYGEGKAFGRDDESLPCARGGA